MVSKPYEPLALLADAEIRRIKAAGEMPRPLHLASLVAVDVCQLARMQFKAREPLLAPWLHSQDLCMVFAPRGVGKTHSASPVLAVATGGRFLGGRRSAKKVLYLDGDCGSVLRAGYPRSARI
jgi:hypothetical protein